MSTCEVIIKKTGKVCGRKNCGYHKPAVAAEEPVVVKPEPVVVKPDVNELTDSVGRLTITEVAGCNGELTNEVISATHERLKELKEIKTGQFYIKDVYTHSVYEVPDDDDCIDLQINGEQYAVTVRRGLLYKCSDEEGDVLVGFSGFGKYESVVPENGKWKTNYTI